MKAEYILTLSEEQAKRVSVALEFYSRMRMGQWEELVWHCLEFGEKDFCEKRDLLEKILLEARAVAFPKLGKSFGMHYGVGRFKDVDETWEINKVLRNKMAWTENPEGGAGVDFYPPISFSGTPLAKCEARIEEDNKK